MQSGSYESFLITFSSKGVNITRKVKRKVRILNLQVLKPTLTIHLILQVCVYFGALESCLRYSGLTSGCGKGSLLVELKGPHVMLSGIEPRLAVFKESFLSVITFFQPQILQTFNINYRIRKISVLLWFFQIVTEANRKKQWRKHKLFVCGLNYTIYCSI